MICPRQRAPAKPSLHLERLEEQKEQIIEICSRVFSTRTTYVFHHERRVASLSGELPSEAQLVVEVRILPVQELLNLVSCLETQKKVSFKLVLTEALIRNPFAILRLQHDAVMAIS